MINEGRDCASMIFIQRSQYQSTKITNAGANKMGDATKYSLYTFCCPWNSYWFLAKIIQKMWSKNTQRYYVQSWRTKSPYHTKGKEVDRKHWFLVRDFTRLLLLRYTTFLSFTKKVQFRDIASLSRSHSWYRTRSRSILLFNSYSFLGRFPSLPPSLFR